MSRRVWVVGVTLGAAEQRLDNSGPGVAGAILKMFGPNTAEIDKRFIPTIPQLVKALK